MKKEYSKPQIKQAVLQESLLASLSFGIDDDHEIDNPSDVEAKLLQPFCPVWSGDEE